MKVLSFSAVEVLPALLSKSKETTIRSAWKETHIGNDRVYSAATGKIRLEKKLAMFRIGEKVKICWRNRGTPKDAKFCKVCGEQAAHLINDAYFQAVTMDEMGKLGIDFVEKEGWNEPCEHKAHLFPKVLGTATITSVDKISLAHGHILIPSGIGSPDEIAQRDGFKNIQEMADWFDKKYDLSQSRRFHVYRWKWDK